MISYEIQRHKPTLFQRAASAVGFNVNPITGVILDQQHIDNQVRMAEGVKPEPRYTKPDGAPLWTPKQAVMHETSAMALGKHGYAKWLNDFVYNTFPKGTLVTMKSEPFVPTSAPRIWFEVIEIQQIHYMAMIDRETRDPKAIGVKTGDHNIPMWYPPAKLRVLQPEEVQCIDILRNQKASSEVSPTKEDAGFATATVNVGNGNGSVDEEGRQEEGNI